MDTMAAEWSALGRASDEIAIVCEELAGEHDRMAAEVDAVLGRWRGEAAQHYRAGWERWSADAVAVIESLAAMGEAIDGVRRSFLIADDGVATDGARLRARLGDVS